MGSEYLPVYARNALAECQKLLPLLSGGGTKLQDALLFCRNLRIAGIASFFLTADPTELLPRLQQSGRAFAHFLRIAPDSAKVTSQSIPFFDAIAAGDDDGAKEIAEASRRVWAPEEEYEEDFIFVELLMQRFYLSASEAVCGRLLEGYEKALQGSEDLRLLLCRALLERNDSNFNDALVRFLAARDDNFQARIDVEDAEVLATEALLSIEGLALVRLAEREGLRTEEDYLHVPSLARRGSAASEPADAWMRLAVEA